MDSGEPSKLAAWANSTQDPSRRALLSQSSVHSFTTGTGASIISATTNFILSLPSLPTELIFITCFWARSPSLGSLSNLLAQLSSRAHSTGKIIRIRITVSSLSLTQKLFHTRSPHGRIYHPKHWKSKLYLPFGADDLPGLDLRIKSVFFPPFSVMHSKFILIDREICLLPSCNVSWEDWFEGCADLRGPVVRQFYEYFEGVWGRGDVAFSLEGSLRPRTNGGTEDLRVDGSQICPSDSGTPRSRNHDAPPFSIPPSNPPSAPFTTPPAPTSLQLEPHAQPHTHPFLHTTPLSSSPTPTLLLPHPPHTHPHFHPLPCQSPPPPPSTPLNDLTLHLLTTATSSIFIRTPNLTCWAVIEKLLGAVGRGVGVRVVTCRKLMRGEQIVTGGRTTGVCVRGLWGRYERMKRARGRRGEGITGGGGMGGALEAGTSKLGDLKIEYYDDTIAKEQDKGRGRGMPKKAHIKCTIVDERIVLVGSGNMDRASWFTSQEVGVAVESGVVARVIGGMVGVDT